jgi:hypothetical protein
MTLCNRHLPQRPPCFILSFASWMDGGSFPEGANTPLTMGLFSPGQAWIVCKFLEHTVMIDKQESRELSSEDDKREMMTLRYFKRLIILVLLF